MSTKLYETLSKEDADIEREDNIRPQALASSKSDRNQRQNSSAGTDRSIIPIRPHIYYGEGTFDPPSSDSEAEEEQLLEKGTTSPGAAERGLASTLANDGAAGLVVGGKKRPASIRLLLWLLCAVLIIAAGIGVLSARSYSGTSFRSSRGTKRITMDHIFNGTFAASKTSIRWVPEMGDGVLAFVENYSIKLVDLKTNMTSNFVSFSDIRSEAGAQLMISDWQVSSDGKYMLVKTDYKKQWRWSSYGNYYIYNIETRTTYPLAPVSNPPLISYAKWSPKGNAIAYVLSNDLYIQSTPNPDEAPIRVTDTGNATFFNGIADWVYEEEVFSSPSTLWWSPDSSKLAFLTLDETLVPEYTFPIYNPSDSSSTVYPYTEEVVMKYPKPGYPNPFVSVRVFELQNYLDSRGEDFELAGLPIFEATLTLDWPDRLPSNDSIIFEVSWVGNETLIVKEADRAASVGSVVSFDFTADEGDAQGTLVRRLGQGGESDDGGWIDTSKQLIYPLPPSLTSSLGDGSEDYIPAYLDIVNDTAGYNHIALFAPASSDKPIFLTSGNWEVTGGILGVDITRRLVYFQAASPISTERNIFSVELPSSINSTEDFKPDINAITDTSRHNYFTADFSPQAGFYMLSYQGPNVPWQSIFKAGDKDFVYPITENARLNATLLEFQAPFISWTTIQSDGYELNVREIRPPNMDDSGRTKYPVLFQVYGGPASQYVTTEYVKDWHHYLASTLKYVVVVVDGRGTGFKGRGLRNPIRGQLGVWEAVDQINAARIWASKPYIDTKKIGIWGWSYGGFLTSKVVEANAGIHSLAMAVAPVTSWRLYDSIYTERYMGLPASNPDGYTSASITNMTGFHNINYLLAHGSGDDNVHFQNSAHLLDMLTQNGVRDFRFRMFTDSDHSISRRGANRELYEFLTAFLVEKWGKGGHRNGW